MKAMKPTRPLIAMAVALAATSAYAGLPQIDDTTWYANQLLWLAVSFIALYLAVSQLIVPSIQSVLSARDTAIEGAIHEAEKAKREAESTRGNVEFASNTARARAAEIMAQMQAETTANAAEATSKLDLEISRKLERADHLIDEAVKKAEAEVEAATQSLAQAMVAKLLGSTISHPATKH